MTDARARCCRSAPRCRSCPLRLAHELRSLAAVPELPPHLEGVPACLHRYEPLLRQSWERREREVVRASAA